MIAKFIPKNDVAHNILMSHQFKPSMSGEAMTCAQTDVFVLEDIFIDLHIGKSEYSYSIFEGYSLSPIESGNNDVNSEKYGFGLSALDMLLEDKHKRNGKRAQYVSKIYSMLSKKIQPKDMNKYLSIQYVSMFDLIHDLRNIPSFSEEYIKKNNISRNSVHAVFHDEKHLLFMHDRISKKFASILSFFMRASDTSAMEAIGTAPNAKYILSNIKRLFL